MLNKISFQDEHFIDNFIEAVPMSVNLRTLVEKNQKGEILSVSILIQLSLHFECYLRKCLTKETKTDLNRTRRPYKAPCSLKVYMSSRWALSKRIKSVSI